MFVLRDVFCGSTVLFLNVWLTAVVSNRRMEKTEVCLSLYSGWEPGRADRAGRQELQLVKTDHVTWILASDWTSASVSSWGSYHRLSRRSQSGFRMIIFMMRPPYCFYWDDEITFPTRGYYFKKSLSLVSMPSGWQLSSSLILVMDYSNSPVVARTEYKFHIQI